MRLLLAAATAALAFPLAAIPLASVATAQTATPPATTATPPAVIQQTPPAAATPAMPMTPPASGRTAHKHQTLQERFDAANTTHDGHLTQPQVQAAKWKYLDKHFSAVDKDSKGYVTVEDIHAYAHATHAARRVVPKPATPGAATN